MKHTLLSPGQSVRETPRPTYVLLTTQLSNSSVPLTHSVHTRPASSVVGRRTSVVGRATAAVVGSSNCNVVNFTSDAAMTRAGNELPMATRGAKTDIYMDFFEGEFRQLPVRSVVDAATARSVKVVITEKKNDELPSCKIVLARMA